MKSTPKLLVISDYRNYLTSRPEAELLIGLQKEGISVTVMTFPGSPHSTSFLEAGIQLIPYHPTKKRSREAIRRIREELIRGKYDLLHLYNSLASSNGIPAAKGLPVKVLLYRGYTGNVHWYDPTLYLKYFHPRVDSIFCINRQIEELFRRHKLFGKHKAVTIIKGHNPSWYEDVLPANLCAYGIPEEGFVVTCVANVRPMKGIPDLLKATQFLPPDLHIHFVFIGNGFDDKEIQSLIQKSPYRSNIHLLGFLQNPLPLVAASSVYVQPSRKGEGLSKSTIEAMSLRVAPVISRIAGNTDLVEHEKSGLLFSPGNVHELAEAILRLYQTPELRTSLGEKAAERIRTHFHIKQTIGALKQHYLELLGKREA
jgi:glycosyltransferase involved in cell wall biosynthesis